jgi:hypothetical protein
MIEFRFSHAFLMRLMYSTGNTGRRDRVMTHNRSAVGDVRERASNGQGIE